MRKQHIFGHSFVRYRLVQYPFVVRLEVMNRNNAHRLNRSNVCHWLDRIVSCPCLQEQRHLYTFVELHSSLKPHPIALQTVFLPLRLVLSCWLCDCDQLRHQLQIHLDLEVFFWGKSVARDLLLLLRNRCEFLHCRAEVVGIATPNLVNCFGD